MSDRCTRSNTNAAWTCVLPEGHEGGHIYTLWSEIAIPAEAAIKRVRELCDQRDAEVADMDAFYRQVVLVSVDEVRRALDGAE